MSSENKKRTNHGKDDLEQQPEKKSRVTLSCVQGDLFTASCDWALAHCVSADLHMNKGIARKFKTTFGSVKELLAQKKGIGQVAVLEHHDEKDTDSKRFVYYLITKQRYFHKPTMESLEKSLVDMREHCLSHQVTRLAIPRLGCGLDRLDWKDVKQLIVKVFADTKIQIRVYTM